MPVTASRCLASAPAPSSRRRPADRVAPGTSSGSGVRINGTYGWLNIGADGSYLYVVDFGELRPGPRRCRSGLFHLRTQGCRWADRPRATDDHGSRPEQSADRRCRSWRPPSKPAAWPTARPASTLPATSLANDFDFEGDALTVDAIRTGPESGSGTAGTIGSELAGAYGWLTSMPTAASPTSSTTPIRWYEALRTSGNTLTDFFTYTVSDIYGATDQATIAVTIQRRQRQPGRAADAGTAVETGGVANATPGSDATGNVLANDSDVDASTAKRRRSPPSPMAAAWRPRPAARWPAPRAA